MVDRSNFVDINIDLQNPTVGQSAFDTLLIYDHTLIFTDNVLVKKFSKAGNLLKDKTLTDSLSKPLTTKSSAYIAAKAALSGNLDSVLIGAGNGTARGVNQKVSITLSATVKQNYTINLKREGDTDLTAVTVSFTTTETLETIYNKIYDAILQSDRLKGAIPKLIKTNNATSSIELECISIKLIEVTTVANPDATITETAATSGSSTATDLSSIYNQKKFYFLIGTDKTESEILNRAAWCETQKKIHLVSSSEQKIISRANGLPTDDIGKRLFDLGYLRTYLFYSSQNSKFPEAVQAGIKITEAPGSATWAYDDLPGIDVDNLSADEFNNAKSKNVNVYISTEGDKITFGGKVVGNEYIDIIVGLDWLKAKMQKNIFNEFKIHKKIPFNNDGIGIIGLALIKALEDGKENVIESYDVTLPRTSDFSQDERKSRKLFNIKATATLKGAIHEAKVNFTVGY